MQGSIKIWYTAQIHLLLKMFYLIHFKMLVTKSIFHPMTSPPSLWSHLTADEESILLFNIVFQMAIGKELVKKSPGQIIWSKGLCHAKRAGKKQGSFCPRRLLTRLLRLPTCSCSFATHECIPKREPPPRLNLTVNKKIRKLIHFFRVSP